MNADILSYMEGFLPKENILKEEPMWKHTTFRTGGCAETFIIIETEEQLIKLLKLLHKIEEPYFILGNGSNLLVSDTGFQGVMIYLGEKFGSVRIEGNTVCGKSGAMLARVSRMACEKGLTGLEFASGIPGSLGGAVVMNAGAYDSEMKDIVTKVRVLSKDGEVLELDNATMEFDYRNSAIKNHDFIVLDVEMQLQPGSPEKIQARVQELSEMRRQKQPLEYPSAGSTFKRPKGHFAGKLIMDAGLKGYRIGDAAVSEKHCGFVVNLGKATSEEIWQVIRDVQEKVQELTGIRLETEVIPVGTFKNR